MAVDIYIYMFAPRHVWLAPEYKLYGKFSTLNMSKSLESFDRIMGARVQNRSHLNLSNDIYLHQASHKRHVHLEQPAESCMTQQTEIQDLVFGTHEAQFDMCRLGKLRFPNGSGLSKNEPRFLPQVVMYTIIYMTRIAPRTMNSTPFRDQWELGRDGKTCHHIQLHTHQLSGAGLLGSFWRHAH